MRAIGRLNRGQHLLLGAGFLVAAAVLVGLLPKDSPVGNQSPIQPVTSNQQKVLSRDNITDDAISTAVPIDGSEEPDLQIVNRVLEQGDTLLGVLAETGLSPNEAYTAIETLKTVFDPRRIRVGKEITLSLRMEEGSAEVAHLERLTLTPETDRNILVRHLEDERFDAQVQPVEHASQLVSTTGKITSSFYEAAFSQGVPMAILLQAYATLGYAIDFQRDIRRGDIFALTFERFDDGDKRGTHSGELVSVSLEVGNRTLNISRYTTTDGYTGFFDAEGRSVETSLIKTPIDGGRLSSLFGKRKHPIFGYTRKHKGIDFAAPRGTPILAAGDGDVVQRKRYGSFGKYVEIRHDKTYTTAYAHLSRYGKGLEPGKRVRQGEIIGYVGATGLASGPNLHYEVRADGKEVNPITLDLPPHRVLAGEELARFRRKAVKLLTALDAKDPETVEGYTADAKSQRTGDG